MVHKIILMLLVLVVYLMCNIYWHKKIIDNKWRYTIYSTIIIGIYIIFALINLLKV